MLSIVTLPGTTSMQVVPPLRAMNGASVRMAGAEAGQSPPRVRREEDSPTACTYCLVVAGADQHLDSPVTLLACLGGVIAREPSLTEGARPDLVSRHAGLDQRVTHDANTTVAHGLDVRVGAARIRVAIESDLEGWILPHVGHDLGDLARLRRANVRSVEIEQDVPKRGPAFN